MLSPRSEQGKPTAAARIPAAGAVPGAVAIPAAIMVLAAGWMAWLAVYQVDDAFIVYRYAANLAHGQGFVFNPGERVEGVTCFLWTLFLAPFAAAGLPLPRVTPWLTAIAGLLIAGLLPGVAARLRRAAAADAGDWLGAAVLAAHPAFAYWSVGA